jgi:hypothetical protein
MKQLLNILLVSALMFSCSKEEDTPDNPYDDVDYGIDNSQVDTLDPYGITSIHRDILLPKCSTPGCHDGTFEPDFRTVMSSYSTLVYHSIIKNNATNDYAYRVVPYDTNASVLQKRLNLKTFANVNDRMPQDNIGTGLPQEDLDRISKWIEDGAKDFQGNVAIMPNTEPRFPFFWMIEGTGFPALTQPFDVLSDAANREGGQGHLEMILDTGLTCLTIPGIEDDSTALVDMQNVRLEFSYVKDDFSNPFKTLNSTYLPGNDEAWYNLYTIDNTYLTDTIIYMRYVMNDGDHINDTHFPRDDSHDWYKSLWSFKIIEGSHL